MPQTFTIPDYIRHEAETQGLDPAIALGIAEKESSFNPDAVGPEITVNGQKTNAVGTFQLLPQTAASLGVTDPHDIRQNIQGGVKYLKQLLAQHQDPAEALRVYGGVKTDQTYVPDALARIKKYQQQQQPGPSTADAGVDSSSTTFMLPPPKSDTSAPPKPPPAPPPPPSFMQSAGDYLGEATKGVRALPGMLKGANDAAVAALQDPVAALRAANEKIQQLFWHPVDTAEKVFGPQAGKVRERYEAGDVPGTIAAGLNVPLEAVGIGSRLQQAADYMREGQIAKGLGATTDVGGAIAAPEILGAGGRIIPRAFKPRLTAAESAAVELGRREGIPIDAATASNSSWARRTEKLTGLAPSGAAIQEGVKWQRRTKLPALGDRLASGVFPYEVSPAQAGADLQGGVASYIEKQHQIANAGYDTLRQLEADPAYARSVQTGTTNQWAPDGTLQTVPVMETMPLPADLTTAKAELRPVYDRLMQSLPLTQREASPGLQAIRQILDGPDHVPASVLDRNLGAIKSLGRGADMPELRDVSQGLAAKAVSALEQAHADALAPAGSAAADALRTGREATAAKYAAQDVLDKVSDEPVTAFNQATRAADASIEHLKSLQKLAPQEIPKIGRAVLESLFERAGGLEGGWGRATSVANRWENLGPQTKQILFGSRAADLDSFFLLTKMLAKDLNPSGTAMMAGTGAAGYAFAAHPVLTGVGLLGSAGMATLMNTRAGVKLLTEGLRIPASDTVRAAAWTAAVANQLHRRGQIDQVGTPPPRPGEINLTLRSDNR